MCHRALTLDNGRGDIINVSHHCFLHCYTLERFKGEEGGARVGGMDGGLELTVGFGMG